MTGSAEPEIIAETAAFLVVYKPHNLHTAPLHEQDERTLLAFCAAAFPETARVQGKKPVEGGLLHRLDYETAGLVLVARTDAAWKALDAAQTAGQFFKEYAAAFHAADSRAPASHAAAAGTFPPVIESGFRAYGPGRKQVRPVPDGMPRYQTRVLSVHEDGPVTHFRLRLNRGFRHQIRAHLAWIGCPITNDRRYGGFDEGGPLALTADTLIFPDPDTGRQQTFTLAAGAGSQNRSI